MADLKGHVILTHAAIEALPLWQREMLAAPFYALEKAGFEIASTGNATSYNFKKTSVEVKSDLPKEILSQIEKALSEKYQIELGKNLTESNKYDIVITVGSEST